MDTFSITKRKIFKVDDNNKMFYLKYQWLLNNEVKFTFNVPRIIVAILNSRRRPEAK